MAKLMVPVSEGGVCLRIDISTARVATNSGIFWWVEEEEEEEGNLLYAIRALYLTVQRFFFEEFALIK